MGGSSWHLMNYTGQEKYRLAESLPYSPREAVSMNPVVSIRPLRHVLLCEIQGILSSSQKKSAWFLEPEESGFHLSDDSADGVDVCQPILRPSGGGSLLIVGHIPAEEARVSGAEASLCERGCVCPGWKRSVHSPGVEQMAARENLLGEDVQLFLSSRCHCSQWLLQLGTGGVNWVWFRPCWGCSPFVPSTVLAFVLGHQWTPVKDPY